jgi:exo-beta-1,3-glucanase (GH17 family)
VWARGLQRFERLCSSIRRWLLLGLVLSAPAYGATCPRPTARAAIKQLQQVMAQGRFVSYQPTSLQVVNGQLTQADAASIERDLRSLRPWFDGLITYGSANGADRVAEVASRLGFRALIMGIWDVRDGHEIHSALAAARLYPKLVVAISLGNERLYAKVIDAPTLAQAIGKLRQAAPQLAITTTEPFHVFLKPAAAPVIAASDFMLVNIHPVFEKWFRDAPDANAAEFVTRIVERLRTVACGPVLVKETGVPTAPASMGFSPARQASFYAVLQQAFPASALQAFAYFSAFDAPWRVNDVSPVPGVHPEEAHWGLFDDKRQAKPVMRAIMPLAR